jgi:PPM family protein phosphatase
MMGICEVGVEISWRSIKGDGTDTNQDYCGIGLRDDTVLCIVLDGATAKPQSGELAQLIARDLVDWFTSAKTRVSANDIVDQLRQIHIKRSRALRWASASYLVALIEPKRPKEIFYAGDCLIGRFRTHGAIEWLIKPHTLANAIKDVALDEIIGSPLRNRLTRSFRATEFISPDISTLQGEGTAPLVIATDGFWAGMDDDAQRRFLESADMPPNGIVDDCSALMIRRLASDKPALIRPSAAENLYIVQSD